MSQTERTDPNTEEATADTTIGAIVANNYRTASIFERHHIDFCCGGNISLAEACKSHGLDITAITRELDDAKAQPVERTQNYPAWELPFLADYIVNIHHSYMHDNTGRIAANCRKIADVHGARHAEVMRIATIFNEIEADLKIHLQEEEKVFFPAMKRVYFHRKHGTMPDTNDISTMKESLRQLAEEHETIGEAMHEIRHLAQDYAIPDDACNTYKLTYRQLKEFEDDLHKHVHLENNILFLKAAELHKLMLQEWFV